MYNQINITMTLSVPNKSDVILRYVLYFIITSPYLRLKIPSILFNSVHFMAFRFAFFLIKLTVFTGTILRVR